MRHATSIGIWRSCGWHMSYFMTPEKIIEKIKAFSHPEFNRPPFTSIDFVTQQIRHGNDVFGREGENMISAEGVPLPRLVQTNKDYFRHLLSST